MSLMYLIVTHTRSSGSRWIIFRPVKSPQAGMWCGKSPAQDGPANNEPQSGTGMADLARSTSNPISLNHGNRSRFMATLSTATVALAS